MRWTSCVERRDLHGLEVVTVRTKRAARWLRTRAGTVPNPADGHDQLGLFRITFDLGTQTLDVNVHQSGVGGVAIMRPSRFTMCPATSMVRSCNVSPSSTCESSRPRRRARTRATSSLGLKGLGT